MTEKQTDGAATDVTDEDFFPYDILPVEPARLEVPLKDIVRAPFNARAQAKDPSKEFQESVRARGVVTPVNLVRVKHRKTGKEHWLLYAGRNRLRACELLGIKTIPAVVTTRTLEEVVLDCGAENTRHPMTYYDLACYYRMLVNDFHMEQNDIVAKQGVSAAHVSQTMALWKCHEQVQKLTAKGQLNGTMINSLKRVKDLDHQAKLAKDFVDQKLNSDEIDEKVNQYIAKLERKAKEQEEKEKTAKKSSRKAAESEGEETEETEEEESEEFEAKDLTLVGKKVAVSVLNYFVRTADKATAAAAKLEKDFEMSDAVRAMIKAARAAGVVEGVQMVTGLKEPPKRALVTSDE